MLTHRSNKALNFFDNELHHVKNGERVQISYHPAIGTYHIVQTESRGFLSGWGVEISREDIANNFVDITRTV